MKKSELEEIGEALNTLAEFRMKPKELLKVARARFPKASRKTIVRAALYNIIANAAANDSDKARRLQDFALAERGGPED